MSNVCPLCGQQLPKSIDEIDLHAKLEELTSAAARTQKQKLEKEFETRLSAERQIERSRAEKQFECQIKKLTSEVECEVQKARALAVAETERSMKRELDSLRSQMADSARERALAVAKARQETTDAAQREVQIEIQKAMLFNEKRLSELQLAREKEQIRHASETAKLQGMVDDLSRKLERQSGDRYGEEGEVNLYAQLIQEFPSDKISRVGRGERGADIIHHVMENGREAGCIVYESKNVLGWQNAFIDQAKKYHTQYETPFVIVVSRALPKKQRGMCVVKEVPIVEPHLAIVLASVMRESIVRIAKLRVRNVGFNEKAQQLYSYIIGNEFQTKFRDLAQCVAGLQDYQRAERTWHENHWIKESALHARIEKRHCEIDAKLHLIAGAVPEDRKPIAIAGGLH